MILSKKSNTPKKVLVVYYTRTGITKRVAQAIAKALSCDIEEIVDKTDRAGAKGYILGGRDAMQKRLTGIAKLKKDPSKYDLVILGTPVWAWTMSPALRTYVTEQKGKFKKVAFFCTMDGSGDNRTFTHLSEILGKKPAATLGLLSREVMRPDLKEAYEMKMRTFVEKL